MDDYLVRAMTSDGKVRALACVTTNLVDEACQGHGTYPTAYRRPALECALRP